MRRAIAVPTAYARAAMPVPNGEAIGPALTPGLAERIEAALRATGESRARHLFALAGNPLGIESRTFGDVVATVVRRPAWYYGYFGGLRGVRSGLGRELGEAVAWLRAEGQAPRVALSPLDVDAALMARMLELGLRPVSFMSVLYGPTRGDDVPLPPGVVVWEARDAYLASRLLGAPPEQRAALEPVQRAEFSDWRGYVAEVDGQLAARAALLVGDGFGSLAAGDTDERLRGRGAQSALLRRRIADTLAAGCDLVVSTAVAGSISQRNMERAGLRLAYTQTVWSDTPTA
jgi:hypothetical protein